MSVPVCSQVLSSGSVKRSRRSAGKFDFPFVYSTHTLRNYCHLYTHPLTYEPTCKSHLLLRPISDSLCFVVWCGDWVQALISCPRKLKIFLKSALGSPINLFVISHSRPQIFCPNWLGAITNVVKLIKQTVNKYSKRNRGNRIESESARVQNTHKFLQ